MQQPPRPPNAGQPSVAVDPSSTNVGAKSLQYQRLVRALDLTEVIDYVESLISAPIEPPPPPSAPFPSSPSHHSKGPGSRGSEPGPSGSSGPSGSAARAVWTNAADRRRDLGELYNFRQDSVRKRQWLKTILLEDSESDDDDSDDYGAPNAAQIEDLRTLLKIHKRRRKYQKDYHGDVMNSQYTYYSAGLLSLDEDGFPEHQRFIQELYRVNVNEPGYYSAELLSLDEDGFPEHQRFIQELYRVNVNEPGTDAASTGGNVESGSGGGTNASTPCGTPGPSGDGPYDPSSGPSCSSASAPGPTVGKAPKRSSTKRKQPTLQQKHAQQQQLQQQQQQTPFDDRASPASLQMRQQQQQAAGFEPVHQPQQNSVGGNGMTFEQRQPGQAAHAQLQPPYPSPTQQHAYQQPYYAVDPSQDGQQQQPQHHHPEASYQAGHGQSYGPGRTLPSIGVMTAGAGRVDSDHGGAGHGGRVSVVPDYGGIMGGTVNAHEGRVSGSTAVKDTVVHEAGLNTGDLRTSGSYLESARRSDKQSEVVVKVENVVGLAAGPNDVVAGSVHKADECIADPVLTGSGGSRVEPSDISRGSSGDNVAGQMLSGKRNSEAPLGGVKESNGEDGVKREVAPKSEKPVPKPSAMDGVEDVGPKIETPDTCPVAELTEDSGIPNAKNGETGAASQRLSQGGLTASQEEGGGVRDANEDVSASHRTPAGVTCAELTLRTANDVLSTTLPNDSSAVEMRVVGSSSMTVCSTQNKSEPRTDGRTVSGIFQQSKPAENVENDSSEPMTLFNDNTCQVEVDVRASPSERNADKRDVMCGGMTGDHKVGSDEPASGCNSTGSTGTPASNQPQSDSPREGQPQPRQGTELAELGTSDDTVSTRESSGTGRVTGSPQSEQSRAVEAASGITPAVLGAVAQAGAVLTGGVLSRNTNSLKNTADGSLATGNNSVHPIENRHETMGVNVEHSVGELTPDNRNPAHHLMTEGSKQRIVSDGGPTQPRGVPGGRMVTVTPGLTISSVKEALGAGPPGSAVFDPHRLHAGKNGNSHGVPLGALATALAVSGNDSRVRGLGPGGDASSNASKFGVGGGHRSYGVAQQAGPILSSHQRVAFERGGADTGEAEEEDDYFAPSVSHHINRLLQSRGAGACVSSYQIRRSPHQPVVFESGARPGVVRVIPSRTEAVASERPSLGPVTGDGVDGQRDNTGNPSLTGHQAPAGPRVDVGGHSGGGRSGPRDAIGSRGQAITDGGDRSVESHRDNECDRAGLLAGVVPSDANLSTQANGGGLTVEAQRELTPAERGGVQSGAGFDGIELRPDQGKGVERIGQRDKVSGQREVGVRRSPPPSDVSTLSEQRVVKEEKRETDDDAVVAKPRDPTRLDDMEENRPLVDVDYTAGRQNRCDVGAVAGEQSNIKNTSPRLQGDTLGQDTVRHVSVNESCLETGTGVSVIVDKEESANDTSVTITMGRTGCPNEPDVTQTVKETADCESKLEHGEEKHTTVEPQIEDDEAGTGQSDTTECGRTEGSKKGPGGVPAVTEMHNHEPKEQNEEYPGQINSLTTSSEGMGHEGRLADATGTCMETNVVCEKVVAQQAVPNVEKTTTDASCNPGEGMTVTEGRERATEVAKVAARTHGDTSPLGSVVLVPSLERLLTTSHSHSTDLVTLCRGDVERPPSETGVTTDCKGSTSAQDDPPTSTSTRRVLRTRKQPNPSMALVPSLPVTATGTGQSQANAGVVGSDGGAVAAQGTATGDSSEKMDGGQKKAKGGSKLTRSRVKDNGPANKTEVRLEKRAKHE